MAGSYDTEKEKMETCPGVHPDLRAWAKGVNTLSGGSFGTTTTTTTSSTTTTTSSTTTTTSTTP